MDTEPCVHQPVYFGVINININERTIGSVDVWRCGACKKRFCEEKQLGIESISDIVGMPDIEHDKKWGVLISKLQKGKDRWSLVKMPESGTIKHERIDEEIVDISVENYQVVEEGYWSFLVDEHVNEAVEI
ncbi:MAG: hypothetical protein F4Y82_03795 [Cenarchaeum sp. SB0665_bin_23]|nr:hypothetical protein [Cenarchaeum sp. SB0667_bin_13]MXY37759.1 hypothetical protein [Cenarchaeum sp. SB0664_bin_35]MXY61224.1 hypothetical protein [Cenarchaeum sp. SB0665_bin_23]MXZ93891.1 hypothetical protein [Cenarchaeum sp. SB0666_bin_15]MYB46147.1 hypothetical protein [Cenarchaeum sp. SB0662_bin_33]MYC79128.1 hypothetical protein [Cenarchaeum sp. SB0661_bin_35]MYD59154.1 hypothetical protein [Cenarchaeum sp. SB0678_bin_8]MYG33829.1 hypothetical protein [Cenarchaeum sp. SB0677_bin_16]